MFTIFANSLPDDERQRFIKAIKGGPKCLDL